MNILFVADVFGRPGRSIVKKRIKGLKAEMNIDICIANCENAAAGKGITEKTAAELFDSGIHILTGGNHLWDRKESFDYLAVENRILKPANYPPQSIGNCFFYKTTESGHKLAILCLTGQSYMNFGDSPFTVLDQLLPILKKETNCIFVDFHAESTAEKRAFGYYFDGKVSAVIGTHTHIQTADEEILPKGTAYITDAGMTGPHNSVIGIVKEIACRRFVTGMPSKFEVAENGLELNGVVVKVNDNSGKATSIERIKEKINNIY